MTITKTIGSAGGRDYAGLQAAWDALPATLADNYVFELYDDSEFTVGLLASGKTVGSYTVTFRPAAGQGFRHHANRLTNALAYNPANGVAIGVGAWNDAPIKTDSQSGVVLDGLQIKNASTGWGVWSEGTNTTVVKNCLVDAEASASSQYVITGTAVLNCVLIQRGTNASGASCALLSGCIVIAPNGSTGKAMSSEWEPRTAKNNIAIGFATAFGIANGGSYTSGSDYNATDLAAIGTGQGTHNLTSLVAADQFIDLTPASLDLRMKAGSSLIGAGVYDAAIDPDILGTARATPPSIGAVEYVAPAGSPPAGTVTIGTITPTSDGASVAFTYDAADQTGFEYTLDAGSTWAGAGTTSPLALTGLTASTAYTIQMRAVNASGNGVASASKGFTTAAADTTAPILTSPTGTKTGTTTANGSVYTDEDNGTMSAIVWTSAVKPSAEQMQAGQNSAGGPATYADSRTVSKTGAVGFNATGLAAGTTYYWHYQHRDAAGNDSAVVTSAAFTTDATNAAPTFPGPNIGAQAGTENVALTPLNVAGKFSDTDALTFSAVGTWPAGVTVSTAGVISGTPTTAGTYSGLKVRATDTASQTVDSDSFIFTIASAAVGGTITTAPLKNNTGQLLASVAIAKIAALKLADLTLAATWANKTTAATGELVLADAGLTDGTAYLLITSSADGTAVGISTYTAAA